jgi:type VI secretion system secreted protein Hcp
VAIELFLKIGDIKGESTDSKHKDEIDVESFSWSVANSAPAGAGSGHGTGRPTFPDFSFSAAQSIASPALFVSCASGKQLKEAVLSARRTGASGLDYYKITFSDVVVTAFYETASDGASAVNESVSFSFQKIKLAYQRQNAKGGLDPPVTAGWDLGTGKKF